MKTTVNFLKKKVLAAIFCVVALMLMVSCGRTHILYQYHHRRL